MRSSLFDSYKRNDRCFVGFYKAFEIVNRNALLQKKIGRPEKLINITRALHNNLRVRFNFSVIPLEPFSVEN